MKKKIIITSIIVLLVVCGCSFKQKKDFIFRTFVEEYDMSEGMFIGIIGSIVPIGLVIYGYYWLYDALGGKIFIDTISLLQPSAIVFKISIIIIAIGAVVGMLGSASAVRKYLKV